ncbi:MAG: hypothetical protein PVH19_03980, partial [Planctomycetia bacterium]
REGILSEETAVEPVLACTASPATDFHAEPSLQEEKVVRHGMSQVSNIPRASVADWRWQDLVVAALVVGLVFVAFVPGLLNQREDARVLACQNNLRQLSGSLNDYSERNYGLFPPIPKEGNLSVASAFGPILVGSEMLPNPQILLCPDSSLSEQASTSDQPFTVPRPEEVARIDSPAELLQTQETMGGSYGYSLGYHQNGSYRPTKNLHRPYFAVLSDSPGDAEQGSHHGGRGQNVLFEDGHVMFITKACAAGGRDNLFRNDADQIAAGLHPNDIVIAAGAVSP